MVYILVEVVELFEYVDWICRGCIYIYLVFVQVKVCGVVGQVGFWVVQQYCIVGMYVV